MNKKEFIEMCIRDAVDDEVLVEIVNLFKEVIPNDFDVESTKDPKGFLEFMRSYAKENSKSGCFCVTLTVAKKLVCDYLKIEDINNKKSSEFINLEDFF